MTGMLGSGVGKAEITACFASERSSLVNSSKSPTSEDTKLLEMPLPCSLATMDAHISLDKSLVSPESLVSGTQEELDTGRTLEEL